MNGAHLFGLAAQPRELDFGVPGDGRLRRELAQGAAVLLRDAVLEQGAVAAQVAAKPPERDAEIVQGLGVGLVAEPLGGGARLVEGPEGHDAGCGLGRSVEQLGGHAP